MGQNLKNLFKEDRSKSYERKANHEDLFIDRLYTELPVKKRSSFFQFRIAASIAVVFTVGLMSYFFLNTPDENEEKLATYTLKNISPELEEIESFYIANINKSLTEINKTGLNSNSIKRYMNRLSILKEEYIALIKELNEEGPNLQSINVLIHNLKLQLELLQELKEQLHPVKKDFNEII